MLIHIRARTHEYIYKTRTRNKNRDIYKHYNSVNQEQKSPFRIHEKYNKMLKKNNLYILFNTT